MGARSVYGRVGGEAAVRQHLRECTLEKMKGYIERNERQVAMMTAQLQAQAREIEELRLAVRRLQMAADPAAGGDAAATADVVDVVRAWHKGE
jgi:hypothetical protein